MNNIIYPLNIYVVWHPNFGFGKTIAEELYSTFCRDYQNPLSRGLNIPVYFRFIKLENGQPLTIDLNEAEKNAIILLIDEEYFLDDNFKSYTKQIVQKANDNNRIFPIKLFEYAYSINCGLNKLQFTDAIKYFGENLNINKSADQEKSINKIKTELLHDLSRLIWNFHDKQEDKNSHRIGSPVKLFLSHAKKDGEDLTIRFKRFIENNLKLDVFFDTVDIANGYEFDAQFEQEIPKSALVVFQTDEYSNREWCRREVLLAKKSKSPIVVVHNISNGEKRAFPYLGNMPTTVLLEDEIISFYRIVNLTLYQVLNNRYQLLLLDQYSKLIDNKYSILGISSPPELFNYVHIKQLSLDNKRLIVLYPDPPLGIEELEILNELDDNIDFTTPTNLNY
ncbi:TIR domain-containing protein [Flavobacterium microcysteis]|uniref:TIR domain-containing protein n=1 Tax=Flavobacterium microcysteis TaxID=2596891 RepID=A0A501QDN5_9FLAO|nr:TIR domain-containing protein [Flavobacterium microcysteis]TPD70484.1 TIR domain-containing protein [Flavobacterium microcysteis]